MTALTPTDDDAAAVPSSRAPRQGLWPLLAVHAGLFAGGAVALSLDPPAQGWGVLAVVAAYVVALLLTTRATGQADLHALAGFLVLVSLFQVLPDWVLADVVGTLAFPDRGGPRFDDVIPLAMMLMWVAPLFIALSLSGGSAARAALLAGLVFAGAEVLAPTLGLWEPMGDTTRLLGVAVYVVPAEVALGWAAATAFALVRHRPLAVRAGAALAVSTFYLGALVLAHFVIDVADWTITT
ncbi:MAG: DUF6989 domain-containing protein [Nocardioides sp.]